MDSISKGLIVIPSVETARLRPFLKEVAKEGIEGVYCDPANIDIDGKTDMAVYHESSKADVVVADNLEGIRKARDAGKRAALSITIASSRDVEKAVEAARLGAEAVLVKASDWKIASLENLIAELHANKTKIFTPSPSEVKMLSTVLQFGIDGVILNASKIKEVREAKSAIKYPALTPLEVAKVTEVKDVGLGDRVCVDTSSILSFGEGMLIGNTAKFLFLIHNESLGSKFTSPRPFRVNAGSVHCYIIVPSGRTKYLSELDSGTEVMVTDKEGRSRTAIVGRVKIERRPLLLIRAETDEASGGVLVQNAETIAFVGKDGKPIPATSIKVGDDISVKIGKNGGRHVGMAIDEFVIEK